MFSSDQQAFDLVEHRRVGHVGIAAIDAAGRDDRAAAAAARRMRADLHRRGVRAQQRARPGNRTCRASRAPDDSAGCSAPRNCGSRPRSPGPSATSKPAARNMRLDAQARARDRMQAAALRSPRPGSVTSIVPVGELAPRSPACSSAARRASSAACTRVLGVVDALRRPRGRSAAGSAPSDFSCSVSSALLAEPAHAHFVQRARGSRDWRRSPPSALLGQARRATALLPPVARASDSRVRRPSSAALACSRWPPNAAGVMHREIGEHLAVDLDARLAAGR